ncbi:MAG TPA: PQQ-binding-like beta-propeller repeat protein [Streptosporangiaceae bacterium]|nr:PQQ-binding-like beta-propeller repeat protein [Streptosporangiaceae bacterium]
MQLTRIALIAVPLAGLSLALGPQRLAAQGPAGAPQAAGRTAATKSALPAWRRDGHDWPMGGGNDANTRSNPAEHRISPRDAGQLKLVWSATVHGSVSATPAVVHGAVYVTDWGGYLTKFDAATGRVIWSDPVSDYDGIPGSIARTSPVVSGGTVYIGDQNSEASPVAGGLGAHLIAVNARTGRLRWQTVVDDQNSAVLTGSPVIYRGVVYQAVSSREEPMATQPSYHCCVFRGSLVAVNATTGKVLWQTFTVPPNGGQPGGYPGGAVWSSTPVIDAADGTVVITTGNNYELPPSVLACQQAGGTAAQCLSPADHINSIMALSLRTGAVRWTSGMPAFDAWNAGCLPEFHNGNCPADTGPDADFADGAHLSVLRNAHGQRERVIFAGQKSGIYWAVDAASGKILWGTRVGPGGLQGGIMWGSATDGQRIYAAEADDQSLPYTLPAGQTINYGSFAALDPATGRVLWQVPDPKGAADKAALTVANGVLYAGSMSGTMYALNAANGAILWQYQGAGSSNAGPAVVGSCVYWGNGYGIDGVGTQSTTFYAFGLGGRCS